MLIIHKFKKVFSLSVFLVLLGVGSATAEYEEIHKCDDFAAHLKDKQKWAKGISDEDLAPPPAIKYCSQAVREHPDTARFYFQLGRAFWIVQRHKEAIGNLNKAADMGHVAAYAYLGEAYRKGLGGLSANENIATQYFQAAAEGGFALEQHASANPGATEKQEASRKVSSASQKPHECDNLAAHVNDKQKWANGVTDEELAPPLAIQVCTQAIKESPNTPRFHFQLGRALWVAKRYEDAIGPLMKAAEMDHFAAYAYLGDAYQDGLGGLSVDKNSAKEFYQAAAEGGFDPAEEVVSSLDEEEEKQTFSRTGFQEPGIIEALYTGDFSKFPTNHSKFTIDIYLKDLHGFFDQEYSMLQDHLMQDPAACGLLFDPGLDQALINKAMFQNNPVWGNEKDPMKQGFKAMGSMLGQVKKMYEPGGMQSLMNDNMMGGGLNLQTVKNKAHKDARILASRYGCEGDVTIQIYKNIRPYVFNLASFAPITNKRLAEDLTEGCSSYAGSSGSSGNGDSCSCALNVILRSSITEDEQELLAASFSSRRMNRMKQKYPEFGQKITRCGIS